MLKQTIVGALVGFAVCVWALDSWADESADLPPEVKVAYDNGKAAFENGDFETAIAEFTNAYNQTGEPKLLFNLAACAERLGDAERAIAYYRVYVEEMPDAPDVETVRERITLLETSGIPEPEPEPEPEQEPDPEKAEKKPEPEPIPAVDPEAFYKKNEVKRGPLWPTLTIAGGSFVLAGGITTAILANKKYNGLETTCKPDCTDSQIKGAKGLAIATDVLFALGGAAVVAGVVGAILLKKRAKAAKTEEKATAVIPMAAVSGGGLMVEGRF